MKQAWGGKQRPKRESSGEREGEAKSNIISQNKEKCFLTKDCDSTEKAIFFTFVI